MDLMKLLETRRTYRRFDQKKKIDDNVVADMKKSLRLYSSAANLQNVRFVFVRNEEISEKIFETVKWAGRLPAHLGTPVEGEKPVMYAVEYYSASNKNKWIEVDSGLAISNLTLAAWGHGVGSCIFDSVDREKVKEILGFDEETCVGYVIAFGYPSHTSEIVEMKDDDVAYYLDEEKNYMVPKRSEEELVEEIL